MQNKAEVANALTAVITILETDKFQSHTPAATDYDILMRACYGPLLAINPVNGHRELISRRLRPEGALEHARALTTAVVELLGGERGASIADVQAALNTVTAAA